MLEDNSGSQCIYKRSVRVCVSVYLNDAVKYVGCRCSWPQFSCILKFRLTVFSLCTKLAIAPRIQNMYNTQMTDMEQVNKGESDSDSGRKYETHTHTKIIWFMSSFVALLSANFSHLRRRLTKNQHNNHFDKIAASNALVYLNLQ